MAGDHRLVAPRPVARVVRGRCVAPRTFAERISCLLETFGVERMRVCGASSEALRRYAEGVPPPLRLVEGLVEGLGVSAEWLVMGRGPMMERDRREGLLYSAPLNELFPELLRRATPARKRSGGGRSPVTVRNENAPSRAADAKRASIGG